MHRITRRQFLVGTAGAAAGCELERHLATEGGVVPSAQAQPLPAVAVVKGTNGDSAGTLLKTALDGLGGIARFIKPGQTVAIKPNATWDYPPGTASSTDPDLLREVILTVRAAGAKRIIVLDSPKLVPPADALDVSGIGAVVDALNVEKVFPGYNAPASVYTEIDIPKGKSYKKLSVIKAATEADVRINMAVAKGHVVQGVRITLCMKHMMGFLADPPTLHAVLFQGIVDLNQPSPVQAQLHILEAIRVRGPAGSQAGGYETEITNPKKIRRLNQIVAGTDPVLIDSYAAVNYYQFKPSEILYIKLAEDAGLGRTDIDKATTEGYLRVFTIGQAAGTAPVATATVAPTATSAVAPVSATATGTRPATTAQPTAGKTGTAAPSPTAAKAGAATGQGTPANTPAGTATTATPQTPKPAAPAASATNTPLPTATPEPPPEPPAPPNAASAASNPGGSSNRDLVLNPNAFLSGALIPAAAIVAGLGVVMRRHAGREGRVAEPPGDATPQAETTAPPAAGSAGPGPQEPEATRGPETKEGGNGPA